MTARNWLIGAGAATLLIAGGLAAGPVASLAQDGSDADLRKDEAGEIAVAEYPDTTVLHVEADDEDGLAVYEVTLSNGVELEIDGNSGEIREHDRDDDGDLDDDDAFDDDRYDDDDDDGRDDDDDRDDSWDATGALDDGANLLPEAGISPEEAVATAQGAAEGNVGEVELERYRDGLVYVVEIGGENEVIVDAMTGEVLTVEYDD